MKKQTALSKAAAPIYAAALLQSGSRYISVANTAKLVRAALRDAFPSTTFTVRSSTYAGGASISIGWTDGPTIKQVDKITGVFEGAGFDGSIDMKYNVSCWMAPDGRVSIAHDQGTTGSMGQHAEKVGSPNDPNAIEVDFGSDYVQASRSFSPDRKRAALAHLLSYYDDVAALSPRPEYVVKSHGDHTWLDLNTDPRVGNEWLSSLIGRELQAQDFTAAPATA